MRSGGGASLAAALLVLAACSKEKRVLDADQPVTDPIGSADPRARQFQDNAYQMAQGGRYFAWYGCGGCHGSGARGALDLGDGQWRRGSTPDRVYAAIAGHGALGARIQPEQRWQLAAYVQQLPRLDAAKRRRQDIDQAGEPQAGSWTGPVR
jgi:cytochrome c oxidase cbb3-type subunit 3